MCVYMVIFIINIIRKILILNFQRIRFDNHIFFYSISYFFVIYEIIEIQMQFLYTIVIKFYYYF